MKNAKKVILFLGAILLVAFGSFNTIGSKSIKMQLLKLRKKQLLKRKAKKLMRLRLQ